MKAKNIVIFLRAVRAASLVSNICIAAIGWREAVRMAEY